ncbi:MAG TPA: hypothetical protein VFK69_02155 [Candidatus Eisenbacteria bacterium]|nr:hypothetical protein [Candidatus Eisenbacteria bacterium]
MSDDRLERVMDQVLDGTATPADAAKLDAALAGDPRARARYDEMRSMFRALTAAAEVPPADLHEGIMEGVRESVGRARATVRPHPSAARAVPHPALLKFAFAFACGSLASAVLVLSLVAGGPRAKGDRLQAEGTMAPPSPAWSAPIALEAPGASAEARVAADARGVRVDLDCRGGARMVRLEAAGGALAPAGVTWKAGPAGRITPAPDGVEIELAGPAHYQVIFDRIGATPADLTLQLQSSDGMRSVSLLTRDRSGEHR